MRFRVGDRVSVNAHWSSFYGMRARVVETRPVLMILIDGDRLPIRVGEQEILEEADTTLTGAE
jgi:hypothetical protein